MSVIADKTALRALVLGRRGMVPDEVRRTLATRLAEVGPDLARAHAPPGTGTVSAYHPIRGEPDTGSLLGALDREGFRLALPVAEARGTPLRFHLWRPGDPVSLSPWRIPEPLPGAGLAEPDVLFVPLAAFDRRGGRLGYGAGFYDGALARLRQRKRVLAIGIAFALQEVDEVPAEAHDERLDLVVTERDTILCAQS